MFSVTKPQGRLCTLYSKELSVMTSMPIHVSYSLYEVMINESDVMLVSGSCSDRGADG